ncbi:condensation domain-containing protein [Cryobacterium sp. SO2]|uniref:condensation domain-containing protein n=1 Tax=Cryobacterium sp. SO2 TaxID=1897060 RepID=UPI00223D1260|nr:condensation domain-containing protein [Cryobacterium sp. SO2]WEO77305.1 condensation domain-containing protein [Cryobacterium sp. SO2]
MLRLVLATDNLDAETSLFSAGGTSMHAEIFARAASEATGRSITFTDVFQNASPAQMAKALVEQGEDRTLAVELPPRSDPAEWRTVSENQAARLERLRLSEATGRAMFRGEAEIVGAGLEIAGLIDVPALAETVEDLVRGTGALRTVFDWRAGTMRQRVSPEIFGLERIDATGMPAVEIAAAVRRPFALDSGRLGRFVLVSFAPDRHQLWIVLEHIVSDAVSWDLVVAGLAREYSRRVTGLTAPSGSEIEPASLHADVEGVEFAALEASWCESARGREAERHWLAQIGDGPVWREFAHPALAPPSDPLGEDVLLLHVAGRDAGHRLRERAAELGTTLHALAVFSLARAAARVTGVPDATIYWYTSNRSLPNVATTVGSVAGITLARISPVPEVRSEQEVRRVTAVVAESMAQAFHPIDRIARVHRHDDWILPEDRAILVLHVNPEPAPESEPAPDSERGPGAVFADGSAAPDVFRWAGLRVTAVPASHSRDRRGYTIDASTRFTNEAFLIGLSYREDMLTSGAARELLDAFRIELLDFAPNLMKGKP